MARARVRARRRAIRRANEALTPLGRVGTPEEVAALMVFLMSKESAYLSGAEIAVDGGFSSCGAAKALSDALEVDDP